jgi:diadenosine tetraphosphate (Ap4A) HIT family hydrolase
LPIKNDMKFSLHPQLEKDTIFIKSLELSEVLLMNDIRYPWIILVPRIENAVDITDLSDENRMIFNEEIQRVSLAIKNYFQPDRLNIAMLGNIVPQLHCHIIARFETDFAWSKPIWGIGEAIAYDETKRKEIISNLHRILSI